MAAGNPDFDCTSDTVPPGALFVPHTPPLIFPSAAAAERLLPRVQVENGVYRVAYGSNGEPYRVRMQGKKVVIEPTVGPNEPDNLRVLLITYLQAQEQPFANDAPNSALVEQVWRLDSEFWQEMDPYGDRFANPLPGWCYLALLMIPAALMFLVIREFPAPFIVTAITALILLPVGVLAVRKANRTDFRRR